MSWFQNMIEELQGNTKEWAKLYGNELFDENGELVLLEEIISDYIADLSVEYGSTTAEQDREIIQAAYRNVDTDGDPDKIVEGSVEAVMEWYGVL